MIPKKTEFFYSMGIDSVVCAINVVAGIIEQQAFMDEMATRIPLGSGRVGITEVFISPYGSCGGRKGYGSLTFPGMPLSAVSCVEKKA